MANLAKLLPETGVFPCFSAPHPVYEGRQARTPDGLDIEFLSKVVKYSRRRSKKLSKLLNDIEFFRGTRSTDSDLPARN
jgi:hypothetical protein